VIDAVGVEQREGDLLVAGGDQRLVAPILDLGDGVLEQVDLRRVVDVEQDPAGRPRHGYPAAPPPAAPQGVDGVRWFHPRSGVQGDVRGM